MSGQLFPTNHLLTKMKILTRRVPPPVYTRNSYSPACLLPFFGSFVFCCCFFVFNWECVVSEFLVYSDNKRAANRQAVIIDVFVTQRTYPNFDVGCGKVVKHRCNSDTHRRAVVQLATAGSLSANGFITKAGG